MKFGSGYFCLNVALALAATVAVGAAPRKWHWHLPRQIAPPLIPPDNPISAAKVALGRRLFYDADLSSDGTMACATCHEQKHAFADGNATHPGVAGEPGRRNVAALANIAWYSPLTFADSTRTTLERQLSLPILGTHPVEMGMKGREAEIGTRLRHEDCYRAMFARAFPESAGRIDFEDIARAIASFERTFVSYGSSYDRGQLSSEARKGQAIFAHDCNSCHAGSRFTDLAYHRLGAAEAQTGDRGLIENTGRSEDDGRFRTPSLRNTALTGPWWHDGSSASLSDAIARHGQDYSPRDTSRLLAFLQALSDPSFVENKALALPRRACGRRL